MSAPENPSAVDGLSLPPMISVRAGRLAGALSSLSEVMPGKTTLPILQSVLFEVRGDEPATAHLSATDLNHAMEVDVLLDAPCAPLSYAMDIARLQRVLRTLPSDTEVTLTYQTKGRLPEAVFRIPSQKGVYKLPARPGEDFPEVPTWDAGRDVRLFAKVDSATLAHLFERSIPFVTADALQPAMMGALMYRSPESETTACLVATDGHCLIHLEKDFGKGAIDVMSSDSGSGVVISKKMMRLAIQNAPAHERAFIRSNRSHVSIYFERTEDEVLCSLVVTRRLIAETFPNFNAVIPKSSLATRVVLVPRDELLRAVKQVALYASGMGKQLRFEFSPSHVRVVDNNVLARFMNDEEVEVVDHAILKEGQPPKFTINFNGEYVENVLKAIDTPNLVFWMFGTNRAAVITTASADMTAADVVRQNSYGQQLILLMPVI